MDCESCLWSQFDHKTNEIHIKDAYCLLPLLFWVWGEERNNRTLSF